LVLLNINHGSLYLTNFPLKEGRPSQILFTIIYYCTGAGAKGGAGITPGRGSNTGMILLATKRHL